MAPKGPGEGGGVRETARSGAKLGGGFSMPGISDSIIGRGVQIAVLLAALSACEPHKQDQGSFSPAAAAVSIDASSDAEDGVDGGNDNLPSFGNLTYLSADVKKVEAYGHSPSQTRLFIEVVDQNGNLVESPHLEDNDLVDGFLVDGPFQIEVDFQNAKPGHKVSITDPEGRGVEVLLGGSAEDIPKFPSKGSN